MIPAQPPRPLSMIRSFQLADFLTLGNAACGTLAVFAVLAYVETREAHRLLTAAALIPLALVLDVLDGRMARFNVTADELSAGADKVKHFEGTPIPSSLILVGVVAAAAWVGRVGEALPFGAVRVGPGTLHPLALLWAVSGSLMISKTLRIPKL